MVLRDLNKELASEIKAFRNPKYYLDDILEIDWLYPWQRETFLNFYNGDYRELVACVGMRSGKTLLASLFATYELYKLLTIEKPNSYYNMPKGSDIYIINVATNQQQSKDTIFSEIESRIDNCEWFQSRNFKKRKTNYEFKTKENRIHVRAEHSSSASLAGKTSKLISLDELARFKETGGERSASIVYDTLKRSLATFGREGKIVSISSPMHKDDYMMRLLRQGRKLDDVYTVHMATWEANPKISKKDLEGEFLRDPDSARRDYGADPPESLETYFKEPEKLDAVVDSSIPTPESEFELPEIEPIKYPCFMAGDPAYKNDKFGIALSYFHPEEGIKVPLAHCFEPKRGDVGEIDADKVVEYIENLLERHNVVWFFTDIWNYPTAIKRIRDNGVRVEQNTVSKKEYDALKEQIYKAEKEGRKILPPNEKLIKEIKELEVHNGSRVDHPHQGSKDIADAVANSVYNCLEYKDRAVKPIAMVF